MGKEQVRKQPAKQERKAEAVEEIPKSGESPSAAITDELLDEIDSVLEENAAEFVAAYRQKGGE